MVADTRIEVRMLGLPLDVWRLAREHAEELTREMQLLAISYDGEKPHQHVPTRLTELVDTLSRRFAQVSNEQDRQIAAASDAGLATIDVTYHLPPEAADASRALATMLDEADEFCRAGDLLTLATPPEAKAYRDWFLGEIVAQLSGAQPTPWPAWRAARPGT